MCDFVTPALLIASTVVAVTSSVVSSVAQANQARAQADLEASAAADASQRGAAEAGKIRMAGSLAIGEAKTQVAASGIDAQSGSPLDAMESIRSGSELDATTSLLNGKRAAWGHTYQSSLYKQAGDNALVQGGLAAGASFLSGAAAMGKYYSNNPSGPRTGLPKSYTPPRGMGDPAITGVF